jgi:hypothetical protein
MSISCWRIIVGPEFFPNLFDAWLLWFTFPLHAFPYHLRSIRLLLTYHVKQRKVMQSEGSTPTDDRPVLNFFIHREHLLLERPFFILFVVLMLPPTGVSVWRQLCEMNRPWNAPGAGGVAAEPWFPPTFTALVAVLLTIMWITFYYIRKLNDQLWLASELAYVGIAWLVFSLPFSGLGIWLQQSATLSLEAKVNIQIAQAWLLIGLSIVTFLVSFGQPILLSATIPGDDNPAGQGFHDVESILRNDEETGLFRHYLMGCLCAENIEFLIEEARFRTIRDPVQLRAQFVSIQRQYFDEASSTALNISGAKRHEILAITQDRIETSVFARVAAEIRGLLGPRVPQARRDDPEIRRYVKLQQIGREVVEGLAE